MKLIYSIEEMRGESRQIRCRGQQIGFVPTMGALHEGHLQLLRTSVSQNDVTVGSIFINPTQFNNAEDYRLYPRLLEQDLPLLEQAGCDLVFVPTPETMYPQQVSLKFCFGALESMMEGAHRPGHFSGVATVVSKLFHIVQPHRAYFGQKDLQQFAIVRQLVQDLNFDLELVRHPSVRAEDGLALSSRNLRLSADERQVAPLLYKALQQAATQLDQGVPVAQVKEQTHTHLAAYPDIRLEYFEIADAHSLQPLAQRAAPGQTALCLAAYLGEVRLIDNVLV